MAKVKPIPDGFRSITPHLVTRNAARAIDFYKQAFGAVERYRMPGPGNTIMHAEITIGDSIVMLGEESPMCPENKCPASLGGSATTISLYVPDADKAFDRAVKAGAKVEMPVMDMFWGDRYGMVSDPSGHRWAIMTHVKDMTPDEIMKAGEAFMSSMGKQGSSKAPASGANKSSGAGSKGAGSKDKLTPAAAPSTKSAKPAAAKAATPSSAAPKATASNGTSAKKK